MPLYQYACRDPQCRTPFEAMNPMAKAGLPKSCPACGGIADREFVAPAVRSDATVYTTDRTGGRQFTSKAMRDFYAAHAKAAGVNVTGRMYDHQLAAFPGDPKAWVGSDTELRQVLEHRGWGSTGAVKVAARHEGGEAPKPGLAEKHVRALVKDRLARDPGQKLSKVVEDVVNDHAPHNGKRIIRPKAKARGKR